MKKKWPIIFPAVLLINLLPYQLSHIYAEDNLRQAPAILHISSTVSDGKLSIPQIVKIAKENDIKIIVFNDFDIMRWQYGLWPLRRIIRKTVQAPSVFRYGIKRYLKDIEKAQKTNPDLVLVPGVESGPFYYWEGNPFQGTLKLCNWYRHMLVIGLENPGAYKNLPSVSNSSSLAIPFRFKNILYLWPIPILMAGIYFLRKREFDYKDLKGHRLGPYSRGWQAVGVIAIIFSLLFLVNTYPFRDFKYDQYHGDQGIRPYQNFIDYVNSRGGMTFWAHPEAGWHKKIGDVSIETSGLMDDFLFRTNNYTGIAIFTYGYDQVAQPGGIWDKILMEYCEERRKAPVWVIGGLGFDQKGDLNRYIKNIRTIFLIQNLEKKEVLKALREGRMYVVRGDSGFILDRFVIEGSFSGTNGIVSSETGLKDKPILKIKGHFSDGAASQVKINVIRNGAIIKTFEVTSPFEIDYKDDDTVVGKKRYYRLQIDCQGSTIITNPIFVMV